MNLARSLERRLERLMEGVASKLFPGNVSAHELAQRLVREADLSIIEGPAGPVVPNVYGVRLHPDDLGSDRAPSELTGELAAMVVDHATLNGWRTEGEVHVQVVADGSMVKGKMQIASRVVQGSLTRWAYLTERHTGAEHDLVYNRNLIGREEGTDVRLSREEVSRRHALLWREGGAAWLADLGSSNGTTLNRVAVTGAVEVNNGDAVVFGPIELTFRTV